MASIGPPALGAKGCVRSAQGGRRMAVRIAMEHPIGTLPRTPFPASRDFPSRGNEGYGEKNRQVIYFRYHFGVFPPLVAGATTFPPQFGGAAKGKRLNGQARRLTSPHLEVLCRTSTGDYKAPLCYELLMKGPLFRALFFPLHREEVRQSRIGGGERSEPITRMLIMPYGRKIYPRNALVSP